VLPTVSPYETDGTWLNESGVLQRVRAAVPPPGDCRQAGRIVADLAERLGTPLPPRDSAGWLGEVVGPHGVVLGV
jgi:anaerobic selenocysteine-containing dehydrogenase